MLILLLKGGIDLPTCTHASDYWQWFFLFTVEEFCPICLCRIAVIELQGINWTIQSPSGFSGKPCLTLDMIFLYDIISYVIFMLDLTECKSP